MRFKVGQKVILKEHKIDSDMNLEIGATGIVQNNEGMDEQPYNVIWDKWSMSDTWWVAEECIRPYKVVLENK